MKSAFWSVLAAALLVGAVPPLDSQVVLQRYEVAMAEMAAPKVSIFEYTVSQFGPNSLEALHMIYRDGTRVRDETLSLDGTPLKERIVHITQRENRYAITRVAPRSATSTFLFVRSIRDGGHLDYKFDTAPILPTRVGFSVTGVVIDGQHFLPRSIYFTTTSADASGSGELDYAPVDGHWVPIDATVTATVNGKLARERISWSNYRFPPSLPASTFRSAKPLPTQKLPPL